MDLAEWTRRLAEEEKKKELFEGVQNAVTYYLFMHYYVVLVYLALSCLDHVSVKCTA
jgi:hypothetical protein